MSNAIKRDWLGGQHMIEKSRDLSGRGAEARAGLWGEGYLCRGGRRGRLRPVGLFLSLPARPGRPAIWDSRCGPYLVGGLCSWAVHCTIIPGTFMLLLTVFSSCLHPGLHRHPRKLAHVRGVGTACPGR